MTPEERLILALKAQNKIVFGNTIGVDSGGECTVVSDEGSVRAIAGTPISAGSCVAIQATDGQWYAVSARESGLEQKKSLYKRKNKPPTSDESGGPVKILYFKEGVFYIGGDRLTPSEAYTLPEGYDLFGAATINNLGDRLNDWIINIRLRKNGKMTLVSVSPTTENRLEDLDIPKIYGEFGVYDPNYLDNEGFSPDVFGLPFFRCFQNGFYTAFGAGLKTGNNPTFDFFERAKIKYVSYFGNTLTSTRSSLLYSETQSIGVRSYEFQITLAELPEDWDYLGQYIKATILIDTYLPDGSIHTDSYDFIHTVTTTSTTAKDVARDIVSRINEENTVFARGYWQANVETLAKVAVRGDYAGNDFRLEIESSPFILPTTPESFSAAQKAIEKPLRTYYSETQSEIVQMSFSCDRDIVRFTGGTDLEYTISIGANQDSAIFIKKSNGQYKTLFVEGNTIREFSSEKFKNPLDGDNPLTSISKYFRPNLVGQILFNIPLTPLTKNDPAGGGQIPLESLDVYITDLSGSNPKITKQTADITQPDISYSAVDASAYIP